MNTLTHSLTHPYSHALSLTHTHTHSHTHTHTHTHTSSHEWYLKEIPKNRGFHRYSSGRKHFLLVCVFLISMLMCLCLCVFVIGMRVKVWLCVFFFVCVYWWMHMYSCLFLWEWHKKFQLLKKETIFNILDEMISIFKINLQVKFVR